MLSRLVGTVPGLIVTLIRKEVCYGFSSSSSSSDGSPSSQYASSSRRARYAHRLPVLMLCRKPFIQGSMAHPCGQCMPCRINRRRVWTHRLMLEQLKHSDSTFVTLTYRDDEVPDGGNLSPKHTQDWLKRIRAAVAPLRLRYYLVGEYGDTTQRPHYHVALFGYPNCALGQSDYTFRSSCCARCDLVRDTWGKGNILLGQLTVESAQYVAGYVVKKMTRFDDDRLFGRHPEFARMSLRPGIGADAVIDVAEVMRRFNLDTSEHDVPSMLRHGKKLLPLGRYLRIKLRKALGKDEKAPLEAIQELSKEVLELYAVSKTDKEAVSVSKLLARKSQGKIDSLEARMRIFKKRGSI